MPESDEDRLELDVAADELRRGIEDHEAGRVVLSEPRVRRMRAALARLEGRRRPRS